MKTERLLRQNRPSLADRPSVLVLTIICAVIGFAEPARTQTLETLAIRGHVQWVHLYGARGRPPVIVSSGDGGWIHLGPHVADLLARHGFFVIGFDTKAYLESFTSGKTTLAQSDEPGDYAALIDFAARGAPTKPVLMGVSEGAGLSVLAATEPRVKSAISGVIGLGLSETNELGWRWKDSVIYLTHGAPHEPSFSVSALVNRLPPVPLAEIHSTHDEFAPLAQVQDVLERARQPKRLWIIEAADHRFSGNEAELDRRVLEAITWTSQNAAR